MTKSARSLRRKNILFSIASLLFLSTFSFLSTLSMNAKAEEALMLPEKVWRLYHVFSNAKIDKKYDIGGDKASSGKALNDSLAPINSNLGKSASVAPQTEISRYDFVAEYGHRDDLAFQLWLPFYLDAETKMNPSSDMSSVISTLNLAGGQNAQISTFLSKVTQKGKKTQSLGDILVGTKYQIWHTGSSPNDLTPNNWRFALALGAYIPTGKLPDPTTADLDTTESGSESFIPGFRTYLDYQVTKWFYINWFTETRFPLDGDTKRLNNLGGTAADYTSVNGTLRPGMKTRTEFEFDFAPQVNDDWSLDAGLILSSIWTGKGKYSKFANKALNTKTDSSQYHSYKPYAGVFYTGKPMPVRTTLSYSNAFAGHNESIKKVWSLKIEMFLKF